jgi:hypothetical protein
MQRKEKIALVQQWADKEGYSKEFIKSVESWREVDLTSVVKEKGLTRN